MIRKLALFLLLAFLPIPAFTAKTVTVQELQQILAAARNKSDADLAWQISGLVLAERLSPPQLASLQQSVSGPQSRQALLALADTSAFLDPSAAQLPPMPAPDFATQRQIMGRIVAYVADAIPQLPNFFATRQTVHFADRPARVGFDIASVPYQPLHQTGVSSATVLYRDGREIAEPETVSGKHPPAAEQGLSTWGVFGPILSTVLLDAAHSQLAWSHWEQGPSTPLAVFTYAVPKEKSHYDVQYCCFADSEHSRIDFFRAVAGYHGEIAADPATGAILRLTLRADLKPGDFVSQADILVEYGPVLIGGKTYICPLRSIALSRGADQAADPNARVLYGSTNPNAARPTTVHNSALKQGPDQTLLNDVTFSQYHVFRAEARILAGNEGAPPQPAESTPPPPETAAAPAPPAGVAVASAAPSAPAPAPPPAPLPPQFTLTAATHLPDLPTPTESPGSSVTFRTTARLVAIDVVALDRKGHPLTGLQAGDFTILDNGRPQTLQSFAPAVSNPSAPLSEAPATPASAQEPRIFSNQASPSPAAAATATAATILILDASNLAFSDLSHAREEIRRFLAPLAPNTPIALYVMRSYGFQVLLEPTTNHALVAQTLNHWMPTAQDLANAQQEEERNRQHFDFVHSLGDLASVNGNAERDPESFVGTLNNPATMALLNIGADPRLRQLGSSPALSAVLVFLGIARHLAAIPGHKNLVWVTSDNVLVDWTDQAVTGDEKGAGKLHPFFVQAEELLNDSQVSVYPLDASQLEGGAITADIGTRTVLAIGYSDRSQATAALGDAAPGMSPGRATAQMQQDLRPIQGEFRDFATATGGRALPRASDLAAELTGIVDDARATYLLTFTPNSPPDGQYHTLTVKLAGHRNAVLRYRTGYLYTREPSTWKDRLQQAFWQPADATDLTVTATPQNGPTGPVLHLNIAGSDLQLAPTEGRFTGRLGIFFLQRDNADLRGRMAGQTLSLNLTPGARQQILREGIPFNQHLDLMPSLGSLRVLVIDENSGRFGTVTLPASAWLSRP